MGAVLRKCKNCDTSGPSYSLHTTQNEIYVSEAEKLIQVQSKLCSVE